MFVTSDQLLPSSRVWIYQSDRLLSDDEVKEISKQGRAFTETWTAHDMNLKAGFEIRYNTFIVLLVDEKQASASGCSIDKSIHFIQKMEKDFSLSLMNRMIFAYKKNDAVILLNRNDFEAAIENGIITDDTIVFNNLVQTKKELDSVWEIPLHLSWHKKLIS